LRGIKSGLILLLLLLIWPATAASAGEQRIVKIGSDVTIATDAKVRCVVTIGGQITVEGTVEKSVTAIGGSVVLTKTAVVGGSVTALGGVIAMARDAEIGGALTEINSSSIVHAVTAALSSEWEGWSWIFAVVSLAIFLVILVLALLIAALLPTPVGIVAEAITEHTFKVVLCGLLGLVLIVPLALLLTISVVGIVLIPLEIIVVACLALMGFIAVGQCIGARVLSWIGRPNPSSVRAVFWGLILLWLAGWLPYIGWMVKVVALVVGMGAVLVTRFGTYRGWVCVPAVRANGGPAEDKAL